MVDEAAQPFAREALGIGKRFGATTVPKGADPRVRSGETPALMGRNGARGSTLAGAAKAPQARGLVGEAGVAAPKRVCPPSAAAS